MFFAALGEDGDSRNRFQGPAMPSPALYGGEGFGFGEDVGFGEVAVGEEVFGGFAGFGEVEDVEGGERTCGAFGCLCDGIG